MNLSIYTVNSACCSHDEFEFACGFLQPVGTKRQPSSFLSRADRDVAWMKLKQLTGVLCDKKVPIKLKDKVYETVIKPTMAYGAECWAVRKKDENRLHVAEMRMLRWIRSKTRNDHVRHQKIQEDAKVCQMSTFLRQKR